MVKAYYNVNHVNWMLCLYLGHLTAARAAALDSQLHQHPANPDSYMDHSGRRVMRGLAGLEGWSYEEVSPNL